MERRTVQPGGSMGSVLNFALMALFAMLSILIVIAGAKVYQSVGEAEIRSHNTRTAIAYLTNKVRASDEAGMVSVEEHSGQSVLVLSGVYGQKKYNTYIYCRDGALCESFSAASSPFDPQLGEPIAEARELQLLLDGALLRIGIVETDGTAHSVRLHLSAEEAGQ